LPRTRRAKSLRGAPAELLDEPELATASATISELSADTEAALELAFWESVKDGIAQRYPSRTVFTRFIPPRRPEQMPGSWRRYYEHCRDLALKRIDPQLIELVPVLAVPAPPAEVIDKQVYSPFFGPQLADLLGRRQTDSLIITGAETDACVLAAVLDAVDLGYRVPARAANKDTDSGQSGETTASAVISQPL
jgi:Isochorismatase family